MNDDGARKNPARFEHSILAGLRSRMAQTAASQVLARDRIYAVCVKNQIAAAKKNALPIARPHHAGLTFSFGVIVRGFGVVK